LEASDMENRCPECGTTLMKAVELCLLAQGG
jgi:hypothetical protein